MNHCNLIKNMIHILSEKLMGLLCIVASVNDGKSGELLIAQGFPFDTMNQGFEVSSKPSVYLTEGKI